MEFGSMHHGFTDPFAFGSGFETFDPYGEYTADTVAADYADSRCPPVVNNQSCPIWAE